MQLVIKVPRPADIVDIGRQDGGRLVNLSIENGRPT